MAWVPRGTDPASREVLVEGVPDYLRPALLEWVRPLISQEGYSGTSWMHASIFRDYDVVARLTPPYSSRAAGALQWPGFIATLPDEELLDFADWLAHQTSTTSRGRLGKLLEGASSAWALGDRNGNVGLVRRVAPTVQAAVTAATSQGSAGALLGEAWAACFGRTSNTEEAYEKAIKAVEEAASTIVSPKNTKATLGTMIRDMKAQLDWKLDLPGNARDAPVSMMEALWTGQESRHGGNGYRIPTQSEAEAAVMLAVPLVQWFTSGAIARRA